MLTLSIHDKRSYDGIRKFIFKLIFRTKTII